MSSSFLRSFTAGLDASGSRRRVEADIGEEWGIVFAHGGVVMASMLRAVELVLDRDDLRMTTAAATFCRPVRCGPVTIDVDVLRDGRNGAQVHATLRCADDADPSPNAVATVVCTAIAPGWPELHGLSPPDALCASPDAAPRLGTDGEGEPVTGFFRQTDWRMAAEQPPEPMRRLAWFSFVEPVERPDGTWVPAMLAVPGDALGIAVVPSVGDVVGAITAPSLQISLQLFAPARGRWLGIDSRCFQSEGSVAAGVATLWNADGSLVASATQTALLRRVSGGSLSAGPEVAGSVDGAARGRLGEHHRAGRR